VDEFDTRIGKQPLQILYFGCAAVILTLVVSRVLAPTGIGAWAPYLLIWLFSVVAYVAPFAIFYLANGKVERENATLKYDRKTVNLARFGLLVVGLISSVYISFFLATEISKALNGA
jgi:hypothetical protein